MDEKEELLYLRSQCEKLKKQNMELNSALLTTQRQKKEVEENLYRIKNSFFFKAAKPLRVIRVWCVRLGYYRSPKRIRERIRYKRALKKAYGLLGTKSFPNEETRKQESAYPFQGSCTFSILVPLYNTPENFLKDMIDSVVNQTYPDWELILADGSDDAHAYVGEISLEYAKRDSRIKYKKLEKNEGISGNTNQCYRMASGDYIGLFDHDDILHPSAFYEYRRAIDEQGADYVYCDEATFTGNSIDHMITLHFKPDYAIDTLRANNYICHFSLFKKELLAETELFRTEFDGSQDHDMILRLTSLAKNVVHVPRILYYWRAHAGSVASDINAKLYCIDAAKRAVADHLRHYGIYNTLITSTRAFETIFRLQYEITSKDKVSVIIPCTEPGKELLSCVDSIEKYNSYDRIEIIIVDHESRQKESLDILEELSKNALVRMVHSKGAFHKAKLLNLGAKAATGGMLLFIHPALLMASSDFISELLMYTQREDVGAAGAKLLFENDDIQHAGMILGIGENHIAGHIHYGFGNSHIGYMGRLCYAQNMTAVSGDCLMVSKKNYDAVGGFDERFVSALYDVDFCLKLRRLGKLNVFTPFAEGYLNEVPMLHREKTKEAKERFDAECMAFAELWKTELEKGDPYYNPNFSKDKFDYTLRIVEKS
ncbi:MAG: glycosyltransferase [Lachnospiraceae bacterium]|nr:glycosyltransferase [Lachnospiraceae bacterium]